MKKILILSLLLIAIITGCGKETNDNPRAKYEGDTAENVTMRIKEGTLTDGSATVIIEDLNINNKENIYGKEYILYEKVGDEWFYMTPIVKTAWELNEYHVNNDNLLEFEIDWEWLYGKLKPGEYKLTKGIFSESERESYSFSVDFAITDSEIIRKYKGDTAENITMSIKDGTLTNNSATIIIKDLSNNNYTYRKGVEIYKKKDNNWIHIFSTKNNTLDEQVGYCVSETGLLEIDENWTELDSGHYKLVKSITSIGEKYTFSTDFTIE
ncbi:MAG: hypothetical protein NC483_06570 [Ruminococcus sp.]|nr:hypothetical protein [Ruminococcus sp.]